MWRCDDVGCPPSSQAEEICLLLSLSMKFTPKKVKKKEKSTFPCCWLDCYVDNLFITNYFPCKINLALMNQSLNILKKVKQHE
jgi:hypothetical protein